MNASYFEILTTGSNITNSTTAASPVVPRNAPNYALAVIYWIIFVVGVTGNLILICVNIWRRSSKQAATQFFMISLASSDLSLLLGNTWIQAFLAAYPGFIFGRVMCKLSELWVFTSSSCSIQILTVIGIDRYFSLSKPGNVFFTARWARVAIACVWIGMLGTGMPAIVWCDIVVSGSSLVCTPTGVSTSSLALFIALTRIITFFIPTGLLIVSYFGIWFKMGRAKKKIAIGSMNSADQQLSRKVARMCTLVVAIFILSWTPYQIVFFYLVYGSNKELARSLVAPTFITACINSCINPIIYGFMWKPMKDAVGQIIGRLRKFKDRGSNILSLSKVYPNPAETNE